MLEYYSILTKIYQYFIEHILAIIALIVSVISLFRTWKTQREQENLQKQSLKLQKIVADLSQKQIGILEREEVERNRAKISVRLEKKRGTEYVFIIKNTGYARASSVYFNVENESRNDWIDYAGKIPIEFLDKDEEVSIDALLEYRGPYGYKVVYSWNNPNGNKEEERKIISVV